MPEPGTKRYITMPGLQERWDCSAMFIERRLRADPKFPRPIRFSQSPYAHRRFVIAEIEQYEREQAGRAAPRSAKPGKSTKHKSKPSSRSRTTQRSVRS